jgi:hypothetical protein
LYPTTDQLTISFSTQTQNKCAWSIIQLTNVYQSLLSVQNATNSLSSGTSLSVTLGSFSSTINATIGAFANNGGKQFTAGSGFAIIGESGSYETLNVMIEFKNSNDTSVDSSITSAYAIGGVACEIAGLEITTKTQSGISRIKKTSTKTQLGKGDIKGTTLKTHSGKSRIKIVGIDYTITGLSRIKWTTTTTQSSRGKILIAGQGIQQMYGKARIYPYKLQVQTGISFINLGRNKLMYGKSRIQKDTLKNQSGVGNIFGTNNKIQSSLSRIQKTQLQTQTGLSSVIPRTEIQTQDGLANVVINQNRQQSGKAHIRTSVVDYNPISKPNTPSWSDVSKPSGSGIWSPIEKPFKNS